jgi:hypothetical protein
MYMKLHNYVCRATECDCVDFRDNTDNSSHQLTNNQGCHMVYFQILGKLWMVLKVLVCFIAFGLFNGPLVYFMVIWYILGSFGISFPVLVY